jgi:hypothetical protein
MRRREVHGDDEELIAKSRARHYLVLLHFLFFCGSHTGARRSDSQPFTLPLITALSFEHHAFTANMGSFEHYIMCFAHV